MTAILELRNVDAAYGPTQILKAVNLAVEERGIATLLGANGAGKTTMLRAICNMMVRVSGEIRFAGERIDGKATEDIARLGVAHVPDGRGTFLAPIAVRPRQWRHLCESGTRSGDDLPDDTPRQFRAGRNGDVLNLHRLGADRCRVSLLGGFWPHALVLLPCRCRVGWMLAFGWGLAAAIGAVAGMMAAPIVYLDPDMMSGILLYGFAGALLGGIDNPWGAVLGGFIVGVLENIAGAYVVGTEMKLTAALMIIVGVLVFKPAGLFGRTLVARV